MGLVGHSEPNPVGLSGKIACNAHHAAYQRCVPAVPRVSLAFLICWRRNSTTRNSLLKMQPVKIFPLIILPPLCIEGTNPRTELAMRPPHLTNASSVILCCCILSRGKSAGVP